MVSASRNRAEKNFAAIEKRQQRALNEQEEVARARADNTARLRALRLAKEAAEPVGKKKKKK